MVWHYDKRKKSYLSSRRYYKTGPKRGKPYRLRMKKKQFDMIKTPGDVKKVIRNSEQMSYDQYNVSLSLSATPSIITNFTNFTFKNEQNNPPDRDELTQRTTQKVFLSTIRVMGSVNVSDATNRVRLCLFRAKRSAQTANPISADECFNDVGAPGGTYLNAPINYRLVDCLWDKQFNLQETTAGAIWAPYKVVKKVLTLKKNLKYNLNDADNTDFPVNDYTYFMVGLSDSSITPHVSGRLQVTCSFKNIGN